LLLWWWVLLLASQHCHPCPMQVLQRLRQHTLIPVTEHLSGQREGIWGTQQYRHEQLCVPIPDRGYKHLQTMLWAMLATGSRPNTPVSFRPPSIPCGHSHVALPQQHGPLCHMGQHGAWHAGVTAWAAHLEDQALQQNGTRFATHPLQQNGARITTHPLQQNGTRFTNQPLQQNGTRFATHPLQQNGKRFTTHPLQQNATRFATHPHAAERDKIHQPTLAAERYKICHPALAAKQDKIHHPPLAAERDKIHQVAAVNSHQHNPVTPACCIWTGLSAGG
jgi:hypothetical protein